MKKVTTLFLASVFVFFSHAQQPILWGMEGTGGAGGNGTIFNTTGNGSQFKVSYSFPETNAGAAPQYTQLCKASNGLLYGLTQQGGAYGNGTLFSFNTTANTYTDLVDFTGSDRIAPGAAAYGSLIQATDGKLYGMTSQGGTSGNNQGVIFSYDPVSGTYLDLYEFSGGSGGSSPQGSLYQANNGLLYGLTPQGGNSGQGDLFSFDLTTYAFTELTDFGNVDPNLANPYGGLVQASNNLLYGMASSGHLFSSDLSGNVTILVTMDDDGNYPGSSPYGNLLIANNGLLYGLTSSGGANENGVLFSFQISNGQYLDLFDFANDQVPTANLIQASNGQLYGFTSQGGSNSVGATFSFDISSNSYAEGYSFSGPDGSTPEGTPVQAGNGLLYGLTNSGGRTGKGTLFSISLSNTFTSILSLQAGAPAGATPQSGLVLATNGKLYGVNNTGGANGEGTLFTIDPTSGTFTDLFSFGAATGDSSFGSLIQAGNGLLYGMTLSGGANGMGTIFSFDPANPSNPPINLYSFTGSSPDYGNAPAGSLFQAKNGLLYGMTQNGGTYTEGNIFSFDPANPGNAPVDLYDFVSGSPQGSLMQASNGLLYGMTLNGTGGYGNIFSFDPANPNNPAIDLYEFTNAAPDYGAYPFGDLTQGNNGLLYGMTEYGGTSNGLGIIFSFDPANPNNPPVNLVNFESGSPVPGSNPGGNLLLGSDGYLYGMTYGGGAYFSGVLFRYDYVNNIYSDIHDMTPSEGQLTNEGSLVQVGVSVVPVDTFLGYTSSWSIASNWSMNIVPDSTTTVLIPSSPVGGYAPDINAVAWVQDMQVNSGATLEIDSPGSLFVYGLWTGGTASQAMVTGNGSVQLVSSFASQQIYGRTQFPTLIANNSGTVMQTNSSIAIFGQLVLQAGQFNAGSFDGNTLDTVTLKATSATSYGILHLAGGSYTGFITDECYYAKPTTDNSFSQHMMGSPVDFPLLSQFGALNEEDDHIVDSDCDETRSNNGSPHGTVYMYDEPSGATCVLEGWEIQSSGDNATDGQGYSVVLTGSGVLSATGRPNVNSTYTFDGTNSNWSNTTLQGRRYTSGWILLSNPYPAPLHFSSQTINQNVTAGWDAQIQVWNTTGTNAGSYQPTTFVAPFQGFMVHVSEPGPATFTFNSGDQEYNTNPTFYKEADTEQLNITATNTITGLTDNTTVGFNTAATSNFDPAFDMNKIPGALDRHTLYTTVGIEWLSNNMLNSIDSTGSVPMGFEPGVSGSYTLSFGGVNSFDATSYLTLQDNQLNTTYSIRNGNYSFTSDSNDNWNRFVLLFTPAAQIGTTNATCANAGLLNITQPGAANWSYTLTDVNNTTLSTGSLNASTPISINLVEGVYTLTLVDANNYTVIKSIQIGGELAVTAAFDSVATAQVNQQVSFTSTSQNATSNSWNFGDGTTGSGNAVTHTYTATGTYTVTLTSTSDSGCTSVVSHNITVTDVATGIQNLAPNEVKIWSNENLVNVSFGAVEPGATVKIYNELGQQLASDQLTTGTLYTKAINNIETGYVIVMVNNGQGITTGKVFISNSK